MWVWAVVAVGLLGSSVRALAQEIPPDDPAAYAVFAGEEVRLGSRVRVYGRVGANGSVRIGHRDTVDGLVASPTIELGRRTDTGLLFCVIVVGGGSPCLPVTPPVISPGELGVGTVAPGTEDIEVPRRAHRAPLESGAYRRLEVGRGSELLLLGGDYLFERVSLGRKAVLRCATDCRIAVRRKLRMGKRASVEGISDAVETALRVDVIGHRARTGVRLGKRAVIDGILWAPTTEVEIGKKARVASVMGEEVRIGSRARIGIEPEAEPQ
jgi:hypothetical protein